MSIGPTIPLIAISFLSDSGWKARVVGAGVLSILSEQGKASKILT